MSYRVFIFLNYKTLRWIKLVIFFSILKYILIYIDISLGHIIIATYGC